MFLFFGAKGKKRIDVVCCELTNGKMFSWECRQCFSILRCSNNWGAQFYSLQLLFCRTTLERQPPFLKHFAKTDVCAGAICDSQEITQDFTSVTCHLSTSVNIRTRMVVSSGRFSGLISCPRSVQSLKKSTFWKGEKHEDWVHGHWQNQKIGISINSFQGFFSETRMLGSIVSRLASPTACVLIHLFAILICHSPITNKFLGVLINILLKFIFTDSLSTLSSQIRCNLFSSTVLSWQGVGGWSIQHRGGGPATDRQTTGRHCRVTCRVAPC